MKVMGRLTHNHQKAELFNLWYVQGGCEGSEGRGKQAETTAPCQATKPAASCHERTAEPLGS